VTAQRKSLSTAATVSAVSLVVAAFGVVLQIVGGKDYPPVPPVMFILLVPAALIVAVRRRWVPALAVLAAVFLTVGLFGSGESARLVDGESVTDTVGLWVQTLTVVVAGIAAAVATARRPA
jgi:hypothetical protein